MKQCLLFITIVALMFGCSMGGDDTGPLAESWSEIQSQAQGSQVKFYMHGGQSDVNLWIDTYVAEEVKQRFGVTLVRVPLNAGIAVHKLAAEKTIGKDVGGIDLLWINGENFKNAREAGVLFGPFAEKLPNYVKYVDKWLASYDFGYPVEGYEVPFGRTQFVFEYDSTAVDTPPRTFIDLLAWVKEHPGRFTYPAPPDFTGAAFVRQIFYGLTGGPERFLSGWDQNIYDKASPKVWEYLNAMKPYLWREGREYPKDEAELDALFAAGEIDISMAYGPQHAAAKILDKSFGSQVRTFVMTEGTLFNVHFVAIPQSAPNKAGALVVANFLLSPEAQLSKCIPANWGDYPSINLDTLSKEQWDAFNAIKRHDSTLAPAELERAAMPEISAEYVEALQKGWMENVR